MVKIDGQKTLPLRSMRRRAPPQQVAITARHKLRAVADETDRAVAKGGGLPGFGRNTDGTEERFGDGAVGDASKPSVESTETEDKAPLPLWSEIPAGCCVGAGYVSMKPNGSCSAKIHSFVQGDDSGKRRVLGGRLG